MIGKMARGTLLVIGFWLLVTGMFFTRGFLLLAIVAILMTIWLFLMGWDAKK